MALVFIIFYLILCGITVILVEIFGPPVCERDISFYIFKGILTIFSPLVVLVVGVIGILYLIGKIGEV